MEANTRAWAVSDDSKILQLFDPPAQLNRQTHRSPRQGFSAKKRHRQNFFPILVNITICSRHQLTVCPPPTVSAPRGSSEPILSARCVHLVADSMTAFVHSHSFWLRHFGVKDENHRAMSTLYTSPGPNHAPRRRTSYLWHCPPWRPRRSFDSANFLNEDTRRELASRIM
jgi:hypothetical protein